MVLVQWCNLHLSLWSYPFNRLECTIAAIRFDHFQRLTLASADENQWCTLLELALQLSLVRLPSSGSTFRVGGQRRKQLRRRLQTVFFTRAFFSELFLELGISERAEGFYSTDKAGSTHQHGSTFKMIPVVLEVRDQEYLNSSNKTKMPSLDLPMEATRHHVLSSLICLVCYSLLHNLSVLRPL